MRKYFISSLAAMLLSGCVQVSESGYYWGDYSHSYYSYLKNASKESVTEHYETLIDIVETSEQSDLKVPAGIFAELGYIHSQMGDFHSAVNYYEKEVATYPESKILMGTLINQLKAKMSTHQPPKNTEK
ncbi:DUF4810 domain-containing protein [Enterovibrio paralichthyis]|uniref:DUF4810 domain-containing protein n=1 Tax=Enterovibrio paralichthyis TaxID=2853805 RepID=UPI001C461A8C|nr:DUF4810 domain-containing protein [Enterovibrio paralichthyis]MBV7299687.1 DUF4810 domain-containing protein [Enterovibrio paralichthyis]